MATVMERSALSGTKADARIRREVDEARSRIRWHDALTGVALMSVVTLAYALVAIILDQAFEFSQGVRICGFVLFITCLTVIGYARLVQPLCMAINPRYAARQIESTTPKAKNALINWVDLQEQPLPETVRSAIVSQAIGELATADTTSVAKSRQLTWLLSLTGLLIVILALLFVLHKPARFASLLKRTFYPFATTRIAPRTEIQLIRPVHGDVTLTAGEVLDLAVSINGRVPNRDAADRVRMLFRHRPDVTEYDQMDMTMSIENHREFTLRVPDYIIQNGFWYKVAAGDAETPEYRVSLRHRPLFKSFTVRYDYPEYTRISPEVVNSPFIEAYRGTVVTLTATTNRSIKSGRLRIAGQADPVIGKVIGEARDGLEFRFRLENSTTYQLTFVSTDDELSDPTPAYPITVIPDKPPFVEITYPTHTETRIPLGGLLAVDGVIGDDFGIDRVTLQARVIPTPNEPPIVLPGKNYREQSFRRSSDGSYPTSLEYRDSLSTKDLRDLLGRPVSLREGAVIEFWLEAADNCTEPQANIGKSQVYRAMIDAPLSDPEIQQQHQEADTIRQQADRDFQQQQDRRLQSERRDAPAPPKRSDTPQTQQNSEPATEGTAEGTAEQTSGNQQQHSEKTEPGTKAGQLPSAESSTQPSDPEHAKDQANNMTKRETPDGPQNQGNGKSESKPADSSNNPTNVESSSGPKATSGDTQANPEPGATTRTDSGSSADQQAKDMKLQEQADRIRQALEHDSNAASNRTDPQVTKQNPSRDPSDQSPKPPVPNEDTPRGNSQQPEAKSETNSSQTGKSMDRGEPADTMQKPAKGSSNPAQSNAEQPSDEPGQSGRSPAGPGQPGTEQQPSRSPSGSPPEPGELDRLFGRDGEKIPPPADTVERLKRDANDLNSPDRLKREQAEKKFDDTLGRSDRERLQQAARDRQSADLNKKKQAEEDVDELTKKAAKKEKAQELAQQAEDLASSDEAKRRNAEQSFDEALGKEGREQLQDAMKNLKSGDPARRQAGLDQLKKMTQQANEKSPAKSEEESLTPDKVQELAEAARDLNSNDPQKRQAAENKLDQQIGSSARRELQEFAKDLSSEDPARRQVAQDKLKDMTQKTQADRNNNPQGEITKQKINDLVSDDPQARQAAEKQLDAAMGEQKRKELQQALQDAKSETKTPDQRQAAQETAEKLSNEAAQQLSPEKDEMTERFKNAKELASTDDAVRKNAKQKFDQEIGRSEREKLQQSMQDMKSSDPGTRQAAEKKAQDQLDSLGRRAKEQQQQEQLDKLAQQAHDLTSDDPSKRQAAEKALDESIGKDQREAMQQLMKDLNSDDPDTAAAAKRKFEELAEQLAKANPNEFMNPSGRSGSRSEPAQPIEGDINDRLKSAELQLSQFEKARYNEELQKKLGYTKEEYEQFLNAYKEMVNRLRADAAKPTQVKELPATQPGRLQRVGEAGESSYQPGEITPSRTGTGSGTAPPGFSEAQRRFAEEAAKRSRNRPE